MPGVEIKGSFERHRIFDPQFCSTYGTQIFSHHDEIRCIINGGPNEGKWKTQSLIIRLDAPEAIKKKLRSRASVLKSSAKKKGYY